MVGLHDEGAAELTIPILNAFSTAEPGVRLVVRTLEYLTAHASLRDGLVDAVIGGATWSEAYEVATLFHDSRGILVGPGHPLYDAEALRFIDVADEPLFTLEGQSAAAEAFFDRFWFAGHRIGEPGDRNPAPIRTVNELLIAVALGHGVNASSASTQRFAPLGPVRYIPVLDAAPIPISVAVPAKALRACSAPSWRSRRKRPVRSRRSSSPRRCRSSKYSRRPVASSTRRSRTFEPAGP